MLDIGSMLSIGTTYFGGLASMKDARNRYIAQIKSAVKSTNYDFQNFSQMRRDAYESAVEELIKIRTNQQSLQSSVSAGLNENFESGGRTVDLLERSTYGDEARAVSSMQQNLLKQNQEINYNMLMAQNNLHNYVNSIEKPDYKGMMTSTLLDTYSAFAQANDKESSLNMKGYETTIWGKVIPKKTPIPAKSTYLMGKEASNSLAEKDWLGKSTDYKFNTYSPLSIYFNKSYF
jgi:hypothetical protein